MVLTDLPFQKSSVIHSRYSLIRRPDSAPPGQADVNMDDAARECKQYAAFLKEQERRVGPDGYVDSKKFSHTFNVRKSRSKPRRLSNNGSLTNVVQLSSKVEKDKGEYEKRIKVIEDHMWQHKQEERELKRVEGDIIKNQRAVRHTLRDYENAITKKKLAEDKKFNHSMDKFTKLSQEHIHKKEDLTKQRIEVKLLKEQEEKSSSRKVLVRRNDLCHQFETKAEAIELKQLEVMRLSQEFENQMRLKEEEKFQLMKELGDLAIALNMEAQKGRVQSVEIEKEKSKENTQRIKEDLTHDKLLNEKLARSDVESKTALQNKRRLSVDLSVTKSHLDIKKRDEQRHLTDTQIRLEDNTTTQRSLNNAALCAGMDLKAKRIDQRLEAHNARRVNQLHNHMKLKKDREQSQQAVWEERFKKRYQEQQIREHEDSIKFFSKMVNKGDDLEQSLYNKVRNAEYARQQQEQSVRRMQQTLAEIKRINNLKLTQEIVDRQRQEKELEQRLLKEKAELDKVHAQREESYIRLQNHRRQLQEDQYLLEEHQREHERLHRIGVKSDTSTAEITY
ncbi:golgin subfamily A member 6-like protein 6 [Gigantopelta aegis]|uniref:golgin subfamily A member 6-like protein 6 n=1 Tax=Gigantopelta aegis TaxID=1735272 RepID=UPI001B88B627|nr:golgin subfamily A member 6-like protein 6 [Gigantopelta aegis]